MGASLAKLSQLPDETQIFFGHEYSPLHPTHSLPPAPARPPAGTILVDQLHPNTLRPSHWDPTWPERLLLGSHLARAAPAGIPLGPSG